MYYAPEPHYEAARRGKDYLLAAFVALVVLGAVLLFAASRGFGQKTSGFSEVKSEAAAMGIIVRGANAKKSEFDAVFKSSDSGKLVTAERISAERNTRRSRSDAVAKVGKAVLLDGRIVIENASMAAYARVSNGRAEGAATVGTNMVVTIDGNQVAGTPNSTHKVDGVGVLVVNEQAIVANSPSGDEHTGPRFKVVAAAAHLRIAKDGSEVLVAPVEAGVKQGKVVSGERRDSPDTAAAPNVNMAGAFIAAGKTPPTSGYAAGQPKPGTTDLPRLDTNVRAAAETPTASLQKYIFPVLGASSYTNDWGAPRASTGIPHQGTDIFADEGTPIVAVADGVIERVGWNSIGGYRFWLHDQWGNAFYHAHLAAFSPIARDGAWVKAGDVIGFVGDTGDAKGTPYHLHFEVHPGNGDAVNPFPFLTAWKKGIASPKIFSGSSMGGFAPLPLTEAWDIAPNAGTGGDIMGSLPGDERTRSIEEENRPVPEDQSLAAAIAGAGI